MNIKELIDALSKFDEDCLVVGTMDYIPQGCDATVKRIIPGFYVKINDVAGNFFETREKAELQHGDIHKAVFIEF